MCCVPLIRALTINLLICREIRCVLWFSHPCWGAVATSAGGVNLAKKGCAHLAHMRFFCIRSVIVDTKKAYSEARTAKLAIPGIVHFRFLPPSPSDRPTGRLPKVCKEDTRGGA